MRCAEFGEKKAQIGMNFGHRTDGRLQAASTRALLDGDGRGNPDNLLDIGFGGWLHERACIGI